MGKLKYYIFLVLATMAWGATPACGKLLVNSLSPMMVTGLRFLSISIILFIFLLITGQRSSLKLTRELLYIMIALGFMGVTVHNGLLFTGLHYTTATNTALIESIGPTATTLLAYIFIGERLTKIGFLGIFISCLGALCIITKGDINVLLSLSFNIGDILILLCEIAWSCYVIISWRAQGKISAIALTCWSSLFGAILCFITGGVTNGLWVGTIDNLAIFGFVYLTLASGIFAFVGWNYGVSGVGASKAGVFVYLVPLTGAILGLTLLGESIAFAQFIGGMLIIAGVVVTVRSKVSIKTKEHSKDNLLDDYPELVDAYNRKVKHTIRHTKHQKPLVDTQQHK